MQVAYADKGVSVNLYYRSRLSRAIHLLHQKSIELSYIDRYETSVNGLLFTRRHHLVYWYKRAVLA